MKIVGLNLKAMPFTLQLIRSYAAENNKIYPTRKISSYMYNKSKICPVIVIYLVFSIQYRAHGTMITVKSWGKIPFNVIINIRKI